MNKQFVVTGAIAVITAVVAFWMLASPSGEDHDHGGETAVIERGPHGGRMLRDGAFALEVAIFESGVPPEFHVYPTSGAAALPPGDVQLAVTLTRLDGDTATYRFAPAGEYLRGQGTVEEPHSFDVAVTAAYQGRSYKWTYASYEGRTTIAPEAASAAGVATDIAGPGTITTAVQVTGRIALEPNRSAHVRARFSGVIREVRKTVGDAVKAGDILALIESNESLQPYQLRAPISGRVTRRSANPGEATGERELFEIADTAQVMAEFDIFPRHVALIKEGQEVAVKALDGAMMQTGTVRALSAIADPLTQTIVARVPLDNTGGDWRPGMVASGSVIIGRRDVPLAVKNTALQTFRDFTVVFAKVGNTYEVRMLELGGSDGETTEVLGGLKPGTSYVSDNSFLIKADIEKSGASHDH
jgi:cobalt-zinc-cadmium efflux system membrane fusion protein